MVSGRFVPPKKKTKNKKEREKEEKAFFTFLFFLCFSFFFWGGDGGRGSGRALLGRLRRYPRTPSPLKKTEKQYDYEFKCFGKNVHDFDFSQVLK